MNDTAMLWATWAGVAAALTVGTAGWIVALRANSHAKTSNTHADEANTIATKALALAESAEARADRLEAAATERRDVQWDLTWVADAATLSLTNIGTDDACDVELTADVLHFDEFPRRSQGPTWLRPGDKLGIKLQLEANAADERWHKMLDAGVFGNPGFEVRGRVTWRSESGVPGIEVWEDFRC